MWEDGSSRLLGGGSVAIKQRRVDVSCCVAVLTEVARLPETEMASSLLGMVWEDKKRRRMRAEVAPCPGRGPSFFLVATRLSFDDEQTWGFRTIKRSVSLAHLFRGQM